MRDGLQKIANSSLVLKSEIIKSKKLILPLSEMFIVNFLFGCIVLMKLNLCCCLLVPVKQAEMSPIYLYQMTSLWNRVIIY